MKILLTGATGFVGRHLLIGLRREGFTVKAAIRTRDQESTISTEVAVVGLISSDTDWGVALDKVDTIVHCAGLAHTNDSIGAEPFLETNASATERLVEQSAKAGLKHFIYLSSILACADSSAEAITEQSECKPSSHYAESKLEAEKRLRRIAEGSELSWTIIRPVVVYGPGVKANMARLARLVSQGVPLPFGAINNKRSLLYVGNLVSAVVAAIKDPRSYNQVFNVADAEVMSTPEIVREIAAGFGRRPLLVPVPCGVMKMVSSAVDAICRIGGKEPRFRPAMDKLFSSLYVDTQKIRSTLDWSPPYTTQQGIERWLRENR